jgi:hypothetical protein
MQIKLKLNTNIASPKGKLKAGSIVELEADSEKNPLDSFWRRCLREARIDNCVEILAQQKTKKVKK